MDFEETQQAEATPDPNSVIILPDVKREVLSHKFGIQAVFQSVLEDISRRNFTNVERNIQSIQYHLTGFDKYLSNTIEAKYYNEYCPPGSTAAEKAAAMPELVVLILEQLDIMELMKCYRVGRTWRDLIERSERLQMKLFLRPRPKSNTKPHFLSLQRQHFESGKPRSTLANQILVKVFSCDGSRIALPAIGSRWKRMLISQPPIYSMDLCFCYNSDILRALYVKYESSEPITIGHLYQKAEEQLKVIQENPPAYWDQQRANVTFIGTVGQ